MVPITDDERVTHGFPATVQIAAGWQPKLEMLAKELGYMRTSATDIEARFRVFVIICSRNFYQFNLEFSRN